MKNYTIATFYKFVFVADCEALREQLLAFMNKNSIKGTVILAHEGINGTVSGEDEAVQRFFATLHALEEFKDLSYKVSYFKKQPFLRTKVKIKPEIVTLRVAGVDPVNQAGTYVKPSDWNALISNPDVVVIDTRNDYEYEIGTFKRAINPKTENFRDFPKYVEEQLSGIDKDTKIAMFCTGGIRCEKSTSYMRSIGFDNVYHLEGGILKYLEEMPQDQSLWNGSCFVFDDRVAVEHGLHAGKYDQCHGCRYPITEEDKLSNKYRRGVHCPRCYDAATPEKLQRASERQKQIDLAKHRNQEHLG